MDQTHSDGAPANRRSHPAHRPLANVSRGEDPRHTRLQQVRIALKPPPLRPFPGLAHVRTVSDEAGPIPLPDNRPHIGEEHDPDEDEQARRFQRLRFSTVEMLDYDRLQLPLAMDRCDVRLAEYLDVLPPTDLVDEVLRHA